MSLELFHSHHHISIPSVVSSSYTISDVRNLIMVDLERRMKNPRRPTVPLRSRRSRRSSRALVMPRFRPVSATLAPLDLTEDNVRQVLADARIEFSQIFDNSVGITGDKEISGEVELAELDGPFVKISLRGRFWHERSLVLARVGNYLKQRIPEILEVDIEDEKQLDDSPENF